MKANEKKINKFFQHWLNLSLILVFLIIIVGGLTRLTDSGLSITQWELFSGILPPLNQNNWQIYFDKYKQIPQFKMLNYDMNLSEFKIIFYWEYLHRILARIIGLFILIPLIYFYLSKKIKIEYLYSGCLILLLVIFQGSIGWYMVMSGLINDVTVSHYRLSVHLSTAILIISTIFWLSKNVSKNKNKFFFQVSVDNLPFQILIVLIFLQIIFGAFVSGLDAGKIYQTWPLMGTSYFPNDLLYQGVDKLVDFDNHSLVQFYHRNLAYIIIFYTIFLLYFIYKKKLFSLYKAINLLLFFLVLQVSLGIFTLISGLNIYLASSHQATSVFLILSAINLYYLRAK